VYLIFFDTSIPEALHNTTRGNFISYTFTCIKLSTSNLQRNKAFNHRPQTLPPVRVTLSTRHILVAIHPETFSHFVFR